MHTTLFETLYRNLPDAVIVCRIADRYPLVYINPDAQLLLDPQLNTKKLGGPGELFLGEVLRFPNAQALDDILLPVRAAGSIRNYRGSAATYDDQLIPVLITANRTVLDEIGYIILYLYRIEPEDASVFVPGKYTGELMDIVFHAAYHTAQPAAAIDKILTLAGRYAHVSRAYIFEEISPDMTRNTYEWCAEGVEPAIQDLQNLRKEDYNYDSIVRGGVYATNDIRELPPEDFGILDSQGIKSLAILPLFDGDKPLGYVGFDDCVNYRKWSRSDIESLKAVADVVASLIVRRIAEEKALRGLEILQTISDNIDSIIYVNTLDSYKLRFINKALSESFGKSSDELIGKLCWQMLQSDKTGPCEYCPIPKMVDADGNILAETYTWEFQNTITKKWYLVHDAIIKWVDGVNVHIETATEITNQKSYEKKLEYFASTDAMTGAHNREWGYKIMQERLEQTERGPLTICFIDLDGLKLANDNYGHDAGDDMIMTIVGIVRTCIRKSDYVFRWGGDEFIILLECDEAAAERVMTNILEKISEANHKSERPFTLSFSHGIAGFPDCCDDLDVIIALADQRMYENKMAKRRK